jgi:hypothetical protein
MNKVEQLKEAVEMVQDWEGADWARIGTVQEILGWDADELADAVTEALADETFRAEPEPHRHRITEADRAYAVTVGGEPRHLISWKR